jgi:hypothetical protein
MPSTAIRNFFYDPAERQLWVTFVTSRRFNHEIRDRYAFREVTRGRSEQTAR